jgi:Uma2 family endonuclease
VGRLGEVGRECYNPKGQDSIDPKEAKSMSEATTLPVETMPETLVETDSLYEIVNGERVDKPPMGDIQAWVATLLVRRLGNHAESNGLGRVVSEMLIKLDPAASLQRRPDLVFFSYERWPRNKKVTSKTGTAGIPDLAIEVISPSNSADEVNKKIGEYFKAGVRRVWVVFAEARLIHIYESPKKNTILDITDELDGGELIPGFKLSLAELFEDVEEEV